ncbi:uncharacterized protein LOC142574329 [Dermacentor variabilis]|uniref:uncharacterized protein LOC142574329 n=1 Tax=Dermacentor variabilis TaxID=34621 RepID=UPI003F5C06A3
MSDNSDTGFPPAEPTELQSAAGEGVEDVEAAVLDFDTTITCEEPDSEQGYADALADLVAEAALELGSPRRLLADELSDDDSLDDDDMKIDEEPPHVDAEGAIRRIEELVQEGEMMLADLQATMMETLAVARRPRLSAHRRFRSRPSQ